MVPAFNDCVQEIICVADPEGRDARIMMENYSLHQIDRSVGGHSVHISGDLVTFAHAGPRGRDSLIFAYSISRHQLLPIADDPAYFNIRPELSGEELVFSREPRTGAPDEGQPAYLAYWNLTSKMVTKLDVPLGGKKVPQDFAAPVVLFDVIGSENRSEVGLWAFELDSGRLTHLFEPPPAGDDSYVLVGQATDGRRAFHSVNFPGNRTALVYETDLATGSRRVIAEGQGAGYVTEMEAEGSWLLMMTATRSEPFMSAYNRDTGETLRLTDPAAEATWPSLGAGVAMYILNDEEGRRLVVQNLTTLERRTVFVDDLDVLQVYGGYGDHDGFRFVYRWGLLDGRVFEKPGLSFFWGFVAGAGMGK